MIQTAPVSIMHVIFLIFSGTAILSTLALFTRQSLLVAYIVLGAILGPFGLRLINDYSLIAEAGNIGIIFLLFLLGLNLQPKNLLLSLRKMNLIALASSIIFFTLGYVIGWIFRFTLTECTIIGAATMFSSTIIGLKLLPTTTLHHQHTGELMISILLLQDLIAIIVLLILQSIVDFAFSLKAVGLILSAFPLLLLIGYLFQKFILAKLLLLFDQIHEYIFILSIGWCLCMAELGHFMGLSEEIGAFIAGISLATHPVSLYIAESLKPLRDFFLVIFFFSIGAAFNFSYLPKVWLPALILAMSILYIKPFIFKKLLLRTQETPHISTEIGIRLGQLSEFSLLIITLATQTKLLSEMACYTLQAATIITFIASCYWVAMRYPTPLATTAQLRRD